MEKMNNALRHKSQRDYQMEVSASLRYVLKVMPFPFNWVHPLYAIGISFVLAIAWAWNFISFIWVVLPVSAAFTVMVYMAVALHYIFRLRDAKLRMIMKELEQIAILENKASNEQTDKDA